MFRMMRWRIAIPYIVLILLSMISLFLYMSIKIRQSFLTDLEETLVAQVKQLSAIIPQHTQTLDPIIADDLADEWAKVLNARVTIIALDGTVIGESHENQNDMGNHLDRPEIQDALKSDFGSSTRFSSSIGYRMMYVAAPTYSDGEMKGFVRIALPINQVDENIRELRQGLYVVTLLALVSSFILALVIAEASIKPIHDLVNNTINSSKKIGLDSDIETHLKSRKMGEIDQLTSIIHVALSNSNLQMERIQSENIKMNEVFAHMTDGVIITDAQGNIRFINPTAQKMFGVSKDDAENHSIAKVLRHHQLIELWQRCRDSDQVQSISSEIGMDKLYINGIATPLGSGMPGGILLLFQDLTQLKKLEIVRRDFVSNISHELRTPLATIKALSETLMDSALEDPPTARKFIQNIDIEVDSLTQIVDELLELSRIESGKLSLKMELISPCQIMHNAVDRLYVQSERSNLTVEINCQESLPPVLADQERIERLMVNLLHNAIKFTPSGGMIRLSAEIHSENNNQFILFTLSDTGIGIPEEDLSRIFERFYKSDRARASGGSGLGLSIAQHIVQIHGGRIWAESIEGKGSSFHFILPLSSNLS